MATDQVLFEQKGRLGLITLNRPQALNALTPEMVAAMDDQLSAWETDANIAVVAIRGAGERAMCAGGDIRLIYDNGIEGLADSAAFYHLEYRLNRRIKVFPKPYVAFMTGATMGGGCGVSVNGRYRVGSETLKLAMPETAIGFAPDVGGSFFLSRMPRNIGLWAGVTASQLRVADAVLGHLVDYFIRAERFESVIEALAAADYSDEPDEAVCEILAMNASAPDAPALKEYVDEIDAAFDATTLEGAVAALEGGSDWAKQQAAVIKSHSPRAVKVAFALIKAGAQSTFEECLAREYRMSLAMVSHQDFHEGVRSKIVDKDNAPKWANASIADVSDAEVEAVFAPIGDKEWTPA
ncbi:MAG: enoyl-CoA hydratase/isomerase family protein [Neomegalonema sp.]|nr:enoyl-CoA hydratase/isomerase family protein [Neomegalonema sp.]